MASVLSETAPNKARQTSAVRTTNWSVETAGPLIQRNNGASTTTVQQDNSASHHSSARVSEGQADGVLIG